MKRFLLIIALAILPIVCHAQLAVRQSTTKTEKIATARTGAVKLMKQNDIYFITAPTTNQFDHGFILYLGEGLNSAIATLEDLIKLYGTLTNEDHIVIDNGGESCTIYKGGLGAMFFKQDDKAGVSSFTRLEYEKFRDVLKGME